MDLVPFAQGTSEMPLHYHLSYTESFRVQEGELTVTIGKQTHVLKPGDSATVPLGVPHSFANKSSQPVKAILEIKPGHQGFEDSLYILYGLAADGKSNKNGLPKSLTHTASAMIMADVRMVGVFSLMLPLLRLLARRAKKNGVERALLDTYCR